MRVVAIIQVRMGSTRLPEKAMLPLAGKSMTQNIIERVKRASKLDEVVLAFPDTRTEADTTFADLAVRCGVGYYRGTSIDENDLVGRYLACAESFNADIIVRIPGDNPCIEPAYVDHAIEAYLADPIVFYSNTTALTQNGAAVDGIGAEVFSLSRLRWLDERTRHGIAAWREHLHQYFQLMDVYDLPESDLRLDVNTQTDYDFIKGIYDHFGHNRFTVDEVVDYLASTKEGMYVEA